MTRHQRSAALTATGLRKSYGTYTVLDGIDLDIPSGSIFALLGPNGAGKTTVVQILSTLISADAGELSVAGHDVLGEPDAVRAAIGVTGQFSAVDGLLTGAENLHLMTQLHRLPRRDRQPKVTELLRRFDLVEAGGRPAATYSGGMRRRLDLAMTLVGDPRVIFLDEPTTGLDPRSRHTMWQIVRELVAKDGVTLFLTTQYLEEADQLADRIAVLHRGKLVAQGSSEQLKRQVGGGHISLRFGTARGYQLAADALEVLSRNDEELTLQIRGSGSASSLRELLDWLDRAELPVAELSVHTPDLDDVFFALTGAPTATSEQEPTR
ncbi:ABC-2 type transport system ATP-binding protein [Crossiella equi]|uniref:ABC-2 type transport system ATP-binding protein n=1 Tax=Crossiella equi TaxID=130796 RepID=A0ABS5AS19_9PSEU|nr:ATP-binding cassette domain-containing protein [Crossiella equi]MBP2478495.1 ABC-2 type transport system ATP-binding protein [Crossiella equi]